MPSPPTITAGGSRFVVFVVACPHLPLSQRAAHALSSLSSQALTSHYHSGRLRLCRLCRRKPSPATITSGRLRLCFCRRNCLPPSQGQSAQRIVIKLAPTFFQDPQIPSRPMRRDMPSRLGRGGWRRAITITIETWNCCRLLGYSSPSTTTLHDLEQGVLCTEDVHTGVLAYSSVSWSHKSRAFLCGATGVLEHCMTAGLSASPLLVYKLLQAICRIAGMLGQLVSFKAKKLAATLARGMSLGIPWIFGIAETKFWISRKTAAMGNSKLVHSSIKTVTGPRKTAP